MKEPYKSLFGDLVNTDKFIFQGTETLNSHLRYFMGFINCYILLQKSRQTIENTKVFVGVLSITSCIMLYRFTLGYDH